MKIWALLSIAVLCFAMPAFAEDSFFNKHEVSIGYAPYCAHLINDDPDYNEKNNHLIMIAVDQWFGMTFRNSDYERVVGGGYIFRTKKWNPFDNAFFIRGNMPIGIMYGYSNPPLGFGKWSLTGTLAVETGWKHFSINTAVVPVAAIMFTWTF
jgi:hypothetical protein